MRQLPAGSLNLLARPVGIGLAGALFAVAVGSHAVAQTRFSDAADEWASRMHTSPVSTLTEAVSSCREGWFRDTV